MRPCAPDEAEMPLHFALYIILTVDYVGKDIFLALFSFFNNVDCNNNDE